jgi:hypothetical protein
MFGWAIRGQLVIRAFLCRVPDQLHESIIHVQLLVAMPQSISRIICDKIHFHRVQWHHIDHVFHQPAQMFVADARYLKGMPVEMKRMLISAAIPKHKAVALSRLHDQRFDIGP